MTTLCHGQPPLTGRTEPWMEELLAEAGTCAALLAEHGSPLNLLDFGPLSANIEELTRAGAAQGVGVDVFVARKANKALSLIPAAIDAGAGLDVASYAELHQCLERGVDPDRIIVTAAVKDAALLTLAITSGVVVSLDNADEASDVQAIAAAHGRPARVALRLAVSHPEVPATRFGLTAPAWVEQLGVLGERISIEGMHFHLNGYDRDHRVLALSEACTFVDLLREAGHPVGFVDMGGGIPMSYLEDESSWRAFWHDLAADADGTMTWRGDRLGLIDPALDRPSTALYPFWQQETRGDWLTALLTTPVDGSTPAGLLTSRGLQLRCEPGRSVLDGCGMTLAEVVFRKTTSDDVPLVGLQMNRTQMRSTSADVLIDPRWLRPATAGTPSAACEAFLVGAYCIEEELILRRRLSFPEGVARGDIAAFVNTGGYLMHILESPSHQLPLALNLVHQDGDWILDGDA